MSQLLMKHDTTEEIDEKNREILCRDLVDFNVMLIVKKNYLTTKLCIY